MPHVRDGVMHDEAVVLAGNMYGLVQIHRGCGVDGDKLDVGSIDVFL